MLEKRQGNGDKTVSVRRCREGENGRTATQIKKEEKRGLLDVEKGRGT